MKRGIRNNNPLNIRHSADQWQGAREVQTDEAFVQFTSMAYGYRAAWKILDTYSRRLKQERRAYNVRNIIGRWAPPSENNTDAYVRNVTVLSGLGGNEYLLRPQYCRFRNDMERMVRLIAAMTCVENGISMDQVDRRAIRRGYKLAFPRVHPSSPSCHSSFPSRDENEMGYVENEPILWDEYWEWSPLASNGV